jgi:hypothetical protein
MDLNQFLSLTPRENYVTQDPEVKAIPERKIAPTKKKPLATFDGDYSQSQDILSKLLGASGVGEMPNTQEASKGTPGDTNYAYSARPVINTDTSDAVSPTTPGEERMSDGWKDAAKFALLGAIPTLVGTLFGDFGAGAKAGAKAIGNVASDMRSRELASIKKKANAGVINMVEPSRDGGPGEIVTVPESQAQMYAEKGYTLTTPGHTGTRESMEGYTELAREKLDFGKDKLETTEARRLKDLEFKEHKQKYKETSDYGKKMTEIDYVGNKARLKRAGDIYSKALQDSPKYADKETIWFVNHPAFQDPEVTEFLQEAVTLGYEYLTGKSGKQFSEREMRQVFGMMGMPDIREWTTDDILSKEEMLGSIRYFNKNKIGLALRNMELGLEEQKKSFTGTFGKKAASQYGSNIEGYEPDVKLEGISYRGERLVPNPEGSEKLDSSVQNIMEYIRSK